MAGTKTKKAPGFFSQLAADESSTKKKTKKRADKPTESKPPARKTTARKTTARKSTAAAAAPKTTRKRNTKPAASLVKPQPTPGKIIPLRTISDPIAAKYDVRNITSLELTLMSNELYTAGRIGREELAMMSFQPELQSSRDKLDARNASRPGSNQPRDAIAEWRGILEKQEEFKSSFFFVNLTRRVISLLESLDRARNGNREKR